jgi:biotin carboxyl carrier protein
LKLLGEKMTIYYVSVGAKEYQVEISNNQSKINGETIQAALIELGERGLYLLKKGPWKRELHVQSQGNSQYSVNASGKYAVVKVEKSNGLARKKVAKVAVGEMKAPISGIVVSVNVKAGDKVEEGDVVVVLESMKMQMLMRAPIGGEVKSIKLLPGQQLAKGDLLAVIK